MTVGAENQTFKQDVGLKFYPVTATRSPKGAFNTHGVVIF